MTRAIAIGGPADGRRFDLGNPAAKRVVRAMDRWGGTVKHEYRAAELRYSRKDGTESQHWFWITPGLTDDEAFALLVAGYRQPKEPANS